jgi:O-antigen/teichoic acid export membrane protein
MSWKTGAAFLGLVTDRLLRRRALTFALVGSIATGLAGQFAVIVSGIIAARMLGPENRGNLALLLLIPIALSQLGNLGLPLAIAYELSRDSEVGRGALANVARPAFLLVAGMVLVHAAILVLLFRDQNVEVQLAAVISLLIIPADSAQLYGLAILQGRHDFAKFNIARLLPAIAYSLLALLALARNSGSLPEFALWFAASYLVVGVATLAVALRRSSPKHVARAPSARTVLRFGLRALIGSVSPSETLRIDQAIVGLLLSPFALGLYVVGVSFTNLPRFVAQSIGVIAYPHVSAQGDEVRARRSAWRFLWLSAAVCLAVILPLELLAGRLIPAFFGESFAPAVGIMQILLISSLFLGVRRVLTEASRGLGLPSLGTVAEIASWFALVPCVALFAPSLGAYGVALAFSISAAVSLAVLVALVHWSQRMRPLLRAPAAAGGELDWR